MGCLLTRTSVSAGFWCQLISLFEPSKTNARPATATIPRINSIRLTGTGDTSLDGELNQIGDFNTRLGTRYAIPAQIRTS